MLQDRVPPFSGEHAQTIIEKALGIQSITDVFEEFDVQPLASASIAQVHTAVLKEPAGRQVVVKVLRQASIKQSMPT